MSSIAKKKTARTNDEPIKLVPVTPQPERRSKERMAIEVLVNAETRVQQLYSHMGSMSGLVPDSIDGEDFATIMNLVHSIECDMGEARNLLIAAVKVAS